MCIHTHSHTHTHTYTYTHSLTHTHTHTQSPSLPSPQPTASLYSATEEEEELVEHYPTSLSPQTVPGPDTRPLSSPSPPIRPGDLTSTDESGSLCPTVESPVRLEPQGPVKSVTCEEWRAICIHFDMQVYLSFGSF